MPAQPAIGRGEVSAPNPISRYIVDLYCHKRRLIIELDGSMHQHQVEYDEYRQAELESQGYNILRFSNRQVMTALEEVLTEIAEHC